MPHCCAVWPLYCVTRNPPKGSSNESQPHGSRGTIKRIPRRTFPKITGPNIDPKQYRARTTNYKDTCKKDPEFPETAICAQRSGGSPGLGGVAGAATPAAGILSETGRKRQRDRGRQKERETEKQIPYCIILYSTLLYSTWAVACAPPSKPRRPNQSLCVFIEGLAGSSLGLGVGCKRRLSRPSAVYQLATVTRPSAHPRL